VDGVLAESVMSVRLGAAVVTSDRAWAKLTLPVKIYEVCAADADLDAVAKYRLLLLTLEGYV
jgi:hypothetical protein